MYQLGGITLPNPKKFTRIFIELGVEHLLMFGKTTKRIENRKEQFILEYQYLSQADINAILSQYELEVPLDFVVTETNLSIASTSVLMDVSGFEFPQTGEEYREHMVITLTEIK